MHRRVFLAQAAASLVPLKAAMPPPSVPPLEINRIPPFIHHLTPPHTPVTGLHTHLRRVESDIKMSFLMDSHPCDTPVHTLCTQGDVDVDGDSLGQGQKKRRRSMKALLSADRESFTLVGDRYRGSFPVKRIEGQIRLYSELAKKHTGTQHEETFASTVRSLNSLRKRLGVDESQ